MEERDKIFSRLNTLEGRLISVDERLKNINKSLQPLSEMPKTCIIQKSNIKWITRFLVGLYILLLSLIIGDADLATKFGGLF